MPSLKTNYISICCAMLFLAVSMSSYSQTFHWAKQVGSTDWDKGNAIAADDHGNVYTTGDFRGTVDFDPGPGTFTLTSGGTQDIFISKLDASGNFVWAKQLGGIGWEEGHAITVDNKGHVYTTGSFLGRADFDPGPDTFNLTSLPGIDIFISKLDTSGNFIWAKKMGGTLADAAHAIAVDSSGNVYTTGYFDGTADFDPGIDTFNLTVFGYSDIFISKLDASGHFVWAKQLGGTSGEVGHSIAIDRSDHVYTTGTFTSIVDFDPGTGTFYLNSGSPGEQEIFISKLDPSGNFIWATQMGGEVGYSLAIDDNSNVYTTGYYDWDDIWISKLDASGTPVWARQIGAFIGYSIALDSNGNSYTTGRFHGTGDFDPGPGTFNLTSTGGSSDAFISKLDSSGNFIWAKQLAGTFEVDGRSIAVYDNDDVYVTGSFNETADFDPGSTGFNLHSIGSYDIFVHHLTPSHTGLSENKVENTYKIYPNPTDHTLILEFEEEHDKQSLIVRNSIGQIVYTTHINNRNRVEIQISGPAGLYMLELSDQNQQRSVVRIVKR